MKLRHVRAVAVAVGVVVALTGARHSSGGGCDSSSGSSSSSSSSGGTSGGTSGGSTYYDDDDDIDTGSGAGGAEETEVPDAGWTADVKIAECKAEDQGLVADVRATNSKTATSSYTFEVVFKDPNGKTFNTEQAGIVSVAPGASESTLVIGGKAPAGDGFSVSGGTCELKDPFRM